MSAAHIHAIILTLNEELHIHRCIESLQGACATITVVDSGSTDRTVEIAKAMGAEILHNKWLNYATQMNFGIDACADRGGWLLRIDADEILDADSRETLETAVERASNEIDGLLVQRRIHFLGRRIKYGGIEPSWQLRLWRNGSGRCEIRWMDEHIRVEGRVEKSALVFSDINLNSLTWWTDKHNSYASREAIDALNKTFKFLPDDRLDQGGASPQAKIRRLLKNSVYMKLPGGVRAMVYFLYRYFLRLGLLDGRPGFYFHLMQGLWYRTLVDAKMMEILQHAAKHDTSITDAIEARTGFNPVSEKMRSAASKQVTDQQSLPNPQ